MRSAADQFLKAKGRAAKSTATGDSPERRAADFEDFLQTDEWTDIVGDATNPKEHGISNKNDRAAFRALMKEKIRQLTGKAKEDLLDARRPWTATELSEHLQSAIVFAIAEVVEGFAPTHSGPATRNKASKRKAEKDTGGEGKRRVPVFDELSSSDDENDGNEDLAADVSPNPSSTDQFAAAATSQPPAGSPAEAHDISAPSEDHMEVQAATEEPSDDTQQPPQPPAEDQWDAVKSLNEFQKLLRTIREEVSSGKSSKISFTMANQMAVREALESLADLGSQFLVRTLAAEKEKAEALALLAAKTMGKTKPLTAGKRGNLAPALTNPEPTSSYAAVAARPPRPNGQKSTPDKPTAAPVPKTYATIAAPKPRARFNVVVAPPEATSSKPQEFKALVKKAFQEAKLDPLLSVRPTPNGGLVLESATPEQRERLRETLGQCPHLKVVPQRANRSRVLITGVDADLPNETFVAELSEANPELTAAFEDGEDMANHARVLSHRICRNAARKNVVVEVSSTLRARLLGRGKVNLGFTVHHVEAHASLVRCYKCNDYGHTANRCLAKEARCANCGGAHAKGMGPCSKTPDCSNCKARGIKASERRHKANDGRCPVYLSRLEGIKASNNHE